MNDLWRTRLSRRRRMICDLPQAVPLSRQQFVSLSQSSCESPVELIQGGRGRTGTPSSRLVRGDGVVLYGLGPAVDSGDELLLSSPHIKEARTFFSCRLIGLPPFPHS